MGLRGERAVIPCLQHDPLAGAAARGGRTERRSRIRDGFQIARSDGRIMVLLLMVAAVTVADDPILVLGPSRQAAGVPAIVVRAGSSRRWVREPWPARSVDPRTALAPARGDSAGGIGAMHVALRLRAVDMDGYRWRRSVPARCCLVANSVTRAVLAEEAGPNQTAAVMAVWAIAWAGSKPFASLVDGTLGSLIGPQWTGMILATPALIPITVIVLFPKVGAWLTASASGTGYVCQLLSS